MQSKGTCNSHGAMREMNRVIQKIEDCRGKVKSNLEGALLGKVRRHGRTAKSSEVEFEKCRAERLPYTHSKCRGTWRQSCARESMQSKGTCNSHGAMREMNRVIQKIEDCRGKS